MTVESVPTDAEIEAMAKYAEQGSPECAAMLRALSRQVAELEKMRSDESQMRYNESDKYNGLLRGLMAERDALRAKVARLTAQRDAANRRNVPREQECCGMTPPAHAQWCWAAAPPHSDDARDAQRYRWLRQENGAYGISNSGIYDYFTGERADEVIDAAMGGKAGGD